MTTRITRTRKTRKKNRCKKRKNVMLPVDEKPGAILSKAKKKRLAFSQQTKVSTTKMNILLPGKNEETMLIGTADRLDYVSDKFSGVKQLYEHRLKKHGTILAVFAKNSDRIKTIIITGVDMGVGPEGLTG